MIEFPKMLLDLEPEKSRSEEVSFPEDASLSEQAIFPNAPSAEPFLPIMPLCPYVTFPVMLGPTSQDIFKSQATHWMRKDVSTCCPDLAAGSMEVAVASARS